MARKIRADAPSWAARCSLRVVTNASLVNGSCRVRARCGSCLRGPKRCSGKRSARTHVGFAFVAK